MSTTRRMPKVPSTYEIRFRIVKADDGYVAVVHDPLQRDEEHITRPRKTSTEARLDGLAYLRRGT